MIPVTGFYCQARTLLISEAVTGFPKNSQARTQLKFDTVTGFCCQARIKVAI